MHTMLLLSVKPFVMLLSLVMCKSATSRVLKYTRVASRGDRRQTVERLSTINIAEIADDDHQRGIKRITMPSGGMSDAFDIAHIMFGMLPDITGTCSTTKTDCNKSKWPPKCFMDTIELMLQRCVVKCSGVDINECVKEIMLLIREAIKTRREVEYGKVRTPVTTPSCINSIATNTFTARPTTRRKCTRMPLTTPTCRHITTRATSPETPCNWSWLSIFTSSLCDTSTCTTRPTTCSHRSRLPLTTWTCCYTTTTAFATPPESPIYQSRLPFTTSNYHDTPTTRIEDTPPITCNRRSRHPFTTSTYRDQYTFHTLYDVLSSITSSQLQSIAKFPQPVHTPTLRWHITTNNVFHSSLQPVMTQLSPVHKTRTRIHLFTSLKQCHLITGKGYH